MSKPDNNYLSFNGPHDNNRVVRLEDFGDIDASKVDSRGNPYDDAIKCSTQLTNFEATFGTVTSGNEDALDINNRCSFIRVTAAKWILRGRVGFTLKGESHDLSVGGPVEGHGRTCDVELGGWSDQARKGKTRAVRLNLWRHDRTPVFIQLLHSERPTFSIGSGPYEYVFPHPDKWYHPLVVATFRWCRRALGLFG